MAWRNVWRNRRRSLMTTAAMSLGLLVMILYSGLVEGYLAGLERNIVELELGDIQIHAREYRNSPSLYRRIENDEAIVEKLDNKGFKISPRLLGTGLAAAGDASAGVSVRALDPSRDPAVSKVSAHVANGSWLDIEDPYGVVVGSRLARILGVGVGGDFVFLGQGADGSMANEVFVVRGILKNIADGVDRSGVYMTHQGFREIMVVPNGVHQLVVKRPVNMSLSEAAATARTIAGEHEALSWKELMPALAKMLESSRGAMFAMYGIIFIVIGILILNAMLMAVYERVREFGVLKAIGVGPGGVMRLILIEAAIVTLLALAIGIGLSIPGLIYLRDVGLDLSSVSRDLSVAGVAWDPIWRAAIGPHTFASPVLAMLIIVGIAAIYPAVRAGLITPVEAMKRL